MATIPITSLTPDNAPPPGKSIRAIVTLSWPYSSSTRQCALLLADPDFRLRNRRGQVRARFTGPSAEAVAKSRIGIGDEVVLGLDGAIWEQDAEATRTPGKSVEGELMFMRRLHLSIVKQAGNFEVNVDAPPSPPWQLEKDGDVTTPLPKPVKGLRLGGTNAGAPSYVYTSPAFMKRLRLSEGASLDSTYEPSIDDDVNAGISSESKWASFGRATNWRYTQRSPSSEKRKVAAVIQTDDQDVVQAAGFTMQDDMESHPEPGAPTREMLPPALPNLWTEDSSLRNKVNQAQSEEPTTPELRPVASPSLPLPSPFPFDVREVQTDQQNTATLPQDSGQGTNVTGWDEPQDLEGGVHNHSPDEDIIMQDRNTAEVVAPSKETSDARVDDATIQKGPTKHAEQEYTYGSIEQSQTAPVSNVNEKRIDESRIQDLTSDATFTTATEKALAPNRSPFRHVDKDERQNSSVATPRQAIRSISVTPQSEKERVMAQTYRSLFGFQTDTESVPEQSQKLSRSTAPIESMLSSSQNEQESGVPVEESGQRLEQVSLGQQVDRAEQETTIEQEERHPDVETPLFSESPHTEASAQASPSAPTKEQSSETEEPAVPPTSSKAMQIENNDWQTDGAVKDNHERAAQSGDASGGDLTPSRYDGRIQSSTATDPSHVEVIELGSSSDEEEELEEQDGGTSQPGQVDAIAVPQRRKPRLEIQDSLVDTDAEDLLKGYSPRERLARPSRLREVVVEAEHDVHEGEISHSPAADHEIHASVAAISEHEIDEEASSSAPVSWQEAESIDAIAEPGRDDSAKVPGSPLFEEHNPERLSSVAERETAARLELVTELEYPPTQPATEVVEGEDVDMEALETPTTAGPTQEASGVPVELEHTDELIFEDRSPQTATEGLKERFWDELEESIITVTDVRNHDSYSQKIDNALQYDQHSSPESPMVAMDELGRPSRSSLSAAPKSPQTQQAALGGPEQVDLMSEDEPQLPAEDPDVAIGHQAQLEQEQSPIYNEDVPVSPQQIETPLYPSLPLSPSNSQTIQDMASQPSIEPDYQQTGQSILPPTPQLTQDESGSHVQDPYRHEVLGSQLDGQQDFALSQDTVQAQVPASQFDGQQGRASSQELVQAQTTPMKKTPLKKSLGARISNVPDVVSDWFSPRRSSRLARQSTSEADGSAKSQAPLEPQSVSDARALSNVPGLNKTELNVLSPPDINGFSTTHSYFTPLARMQKLVNPASSQSQGPNTVDILAIVADSTADPIRAKKGPRDYSTIFEVQDASIISDHAVRVEVYRPWKATLPVASVGDIILLRAFIVKSRKHQPYLLSTDASAWCVWRYDDSSIADGMNGKPIWARKRTSFSGTAREEMKGPPVELGDEEREHADRLRGWWQALPSANGTPADSGSMSAKAAPAVSARL